MTREYLCQGAIEVAASCSELDLVSLMEWTANGRIGIAEGDEPDDAESLGLTVYRCNSITEEEAA